jgi:hypothetical protein
MSFASFYFIPTGRSLMADVVLFFLFSFEMQILMREKALIFMSGEVRLQQPSFSPHVEM